MAQAKTVSGFFDDYARGFDAIYGTKSTLPNRLINKYLRRSMRLRFERTITGCEPIASGSVIDVGCGPGHYAVELARRGAARVVGLDFAPGMIELARERARAAGVEDRCTFQLVDFYQYPLDERFDYAVFMGFMDYIREPEPLVERALQMVERKAFFSFPVSDGVLAWQRTLRYRRRCDLFLYGRGRLDEIFARARELGFQVTVERIARDFFVTASRA